METIPYKGTKEEMDRFQADLKGSLEKLLKGFHITEDLIRQARAVLVERLMVEVAEGRIEPDTLEIDLYIDEETNRLMIGFLPVRKDEDMNDETVILVDDSYREKGVTMPELKKPTIAFDVDGVLRDIVQFTLDNETVLDELAPENRKRPSEITSYGDFVDLFESKEQWRRLLNDTHTWAYARPITPMVNVWFKLREQGYDCIIVTSNSHRQGQQQTVEWLHKYLAPKGEGIDIHFVNDKSTVEYQVIIEDMPMNAARASEDGRLAFLVKRPWTDLNKQKADSKDRLVTKWNPMLFVQLPDDHEALPVIERKLAWFEGFREATAVLKARAGVE